MSENQLIEIVGLVSGIIAATIGLIQYRNSIKIRRSEWIHKLYQQFYVGAELKEIRILMGIESGRIKIGHVIVISKNTLNEEELRLRSNFSDYCNFFEFMLFLKKSKVLTDNDIKDIFDFYLRQFLSSEDILGYLSQYGFELLYEYLNKIKIEQKVQNND